MSSNQDDGRDVLHNGEDRIDGGDLSEESSVIQTSIPTDARPITQEVEEEEELIPRLDSEDGLDDHLDTEPESNIPQFLDEADPLPPDHQNSSLDDNASIPDDSPSVGDSLPSSPRSRTPSLSSPVRRGSPSTPRRPFDRRFQSRISSSSLLTPRAGSPAFFSAHSRQTSLASLGAPTLSEPDESEAPWEVMRWNKLKKLTAQCFSEIGKRKFGEPTCLVVTDQIVLGTSRGMILVFDYQQNHKVIIGAGTKAIECGAVTALAISADHTTIAAGHATGHIFTWEILKPARPFLQILPVDVSQPQARRTDGHVSGSYVVHIGFLGYRHTALVSADDRGMAFSHLATRGMGAVARVVRTTRILGRYPDVVSRASKPLKKSSVLAFSPLPLGNVEQRTDGLGLVAMLTPYLLVIVSTTPIAQTQHKAARPKEVAAHSAMTAALAWFPAIKLKGKDSETSKPKLAYAWSNVMTLLEVHEVLPEIETEKEKPPDLQFLTRSRFKSEEAIVAVQWLSRSVLAVLTITQQLLILEDTSMHVTESFDLLPKNIYHADLYSQQLQSIVETLDEEDSSMHGVVADAFHMSIRAYKNRLFLLGHNDIWWGSLTNWADRLLALMNVGDFIGAIRLATKYYVGHSERLTIGLPEDQTTRANMVGERLLEMMSASLKYAFGKNQKAGNEPIEKPQMTELAEACIAAAIAIEDQDFLFEEVFSWYDDHEQGAMFVDVLEPFILDGQISSLPPAVVKTLIDHFTGTHTPSKLEELICLLDTSSMDLDQVTTLCKKHNLYDAYIYVWNKSLNDFVSPLEELLQLATGITGMNGVADTQSHRRNNAQKIFPYISFILTSRTYPTGLQMYYEVADAAKSQIYGFFFSGVKKSTPRGRKVDRDPAGSSHAYENLRKVLNFDAPSFMSALNEAFEDSFLNPSDDDGTNGFVTQQVMASQRTSYNRQLLIRILLEVMSTGFDAEDTIYLDMFIARNLPKYPQYLLLSGTALEEILVRLCHYPDNAMREDAQLSVEYLLSVYDSSNLLPLIPLLREAQFYRVLKSVFRQEHQYANLIKTFFDDQEDQEQIFQTLRQVLQPESTTSAQERGQVLEIIEEHALDLMRIDVRRTATTIDDVANHLHNIFLEALADDEYEQYEYLNVLLESEDPNRVQQKRKASMLEQYVRLMCVFRPEHVPEYVETVKEGDLRLQEVLPVMENTGIIDAAVILQARSGKVREAMSRLTLHLTTLKGALQGLLERALDTSDNVSTNEAIESLLSSIEKYARVGIWLCQGQSRISQQSKPLLKSPKRASLLKQPLSQDESLWLDLILAVVGIARGTSRKTIEKTGVEETDEITLSLRNIIQQVFTALLTATTSSRHSSKSASDFTFLRILRAFLSHAAEASPSLSELRNVISSIFSAYAHEESLLALSNSMLDKDVFLHVDHVTQLRQQGWRPRGQICEVCRRRVWGPGIGGHVWEAWQSKEENRAMRRHHIGETDLMHDEETSRGKGKAAADVPPHVAPEEDVVGTSESPPSELGPIVVFSCRHMYHQACLRTGHWKEEDGEQAVTPGGHAQFACPACA